MQEYDIKIIGLDLDGTVFNSKKEITPRTLAAIEAACKQGIYVLPATGRPVAGIPEAFLAVPGVRYALTSNGATVTDLTTGHRLVNQCFETEAALAVYDLLGPTDCSLNLFIDGKRYATPDVVEKAIQYAPPGMGKYIMNTIYPVPDLRQAIRECSGVEKVTIMYQDLSVRAKAMEDLARLYPELEVTYSFETNLEINAPGVTKGTGLLALAEKLGYGPENVMACGDSTNDLAMLRAVGLSVAMGNASPDIKAVAKVVTADNDHDGVALAIERYALKK